MQVTTIGPEYTFKLGQILSRYLKPGDIIALFGNLGSGKTTFVKGIARGRKIKPKTVNSPSFVLINEYNSKPALYHFDLYRINDTAQIYRLGYEEYFFGKGICCIEWAEKLKGLLPREYLRIELFHKNKNKRLLKFTPYGRRYKELIKDICAY